MTDEMSCAVGSAFTLEEAARALGTSPPAGAADVQISGICIDSRDAHPGMLFVALEGQSEDGHRYVPDALGRGAAAALVARDRSDTGGEAGPLLPVDDPLLALGGLAHWYMKRFFIRSVALTGSTGKTTCKDFLASCLNGPYCTLKTLGNYNTEIGVPLTLFRLAPQHDAAVVELAMRNLGDIRYLAEMVSPEFGILTNVGESHLENLGSIQNIARAKAELFRELPSDGWAVINLDDPWGEWIAERTAADVRYYSRHPRERSVVWVEDLVFDRWVRPSFTLCLPGERRVRVDLPVAGEHHVDNAAAAAAAADLMEVSARDICCGLRGADLTGMRMQWQECGDIFILNDVYNSSPASCRAALDTLQRARVGSRRVAILGDMLELGQSSADRHGEVGRIAANSELDLLLTVGEQARRIGESAVRTGFPSSAQRHYGSRRELIDDLSDAVLAGDAVLVKASRGCELEVVVDALMREYSAGGGGGS